jgi:RHS repeat-associated protein
LTSASGAGNTASYTYDAQGLRKTKTVNGSTTVFVTDADNREVLEYDGTSGAIQRWYAYALGPNDALNQMNVVAGTRATLVPDILGSIIGSQDSSSGALTKIGYLPYGKSPSAGPFGFTGQRVDVETGGFYYYRARHYSPAWGRFLQADPIGYADGANLYAYVRNDPLNNTDPLGLDALVIVSGRRSDSYNVFGHVSIAVTGGGIFSFGTGTAMGSSVSTFVNSQSQVRSQTLFTIQTSPEQDAAMLSYLRAQSDNIGLVDNCAARTCGALNAGGVLNLATARTPDAIATQMYMSGLSPDRVNVPQNTSVATSLTSQFEPYSFASPANPPRGPGK